MKLFGHTKKYKKILKYELKQEINDLQKSKNEKDREGCPHD